jgi:hypothetical protein
MVKPKKEKDTSVYILKIKNGNYKLIKMRKGEKDE